MTQTVPVKVRLLKQPFDYIAYYVDGPDFELVRPDMIRKRLCVGIKEPIEPLKKSRLWYADVKKNNISHSSLKDEMRGKRLHWEFNVADTFLVIASLLEAHRAGTTGILPEVKNAAFFYTPNCVVTLARNADNTKWGFTTFENDERDSMLSGFRVFGFQ